MTHWHAYTYTGPARPKDSDARNPATVAPPLVIAEWPAKPSSMLAGTFTAPKDAIGWLAKEMTAAPPLPSAVSTELMLVYARERIQGTPGDVVTRYYTGSGYVARDLVPCAGRCPDPPC